MRAIRYAVQVCLSREPTEDEQVMLAQLLDTFRQQCRDQPEAVKALVGPTMPENVAPAEAAAWVAMARTLMNLDEFVTRE